MAKEGVSRRQVLPEKSNKIIERGGNPIFEVLSSLIQKNR